MMAAVVAAAILMLSPNTAPDAAEYYASSIREQFQTHGVDPLLLVAVIHVETGGTWNPELVSPTHDYGLMQNHVSRTTNAEYVGRERLLLDPQINIEVGATNLVSWRGYHRTHCKDEAHRWWAHYKWGRLVKNTAYSKKVARVYARLLRKFGNQRPQLVLGGMDDHSSGGPGCFWQEYPGSTTCRALQRDRLLVSPLRGSSRAGNQKALARNPCIDDKRRIGLSPV